MNVSDGGNAASEVAAGQRLQLTADGRHHHLEGRLVVDDSLIEIQTDLGWLSAHYRDALHPDSGLPAVDLHITSASSAGHEHVRVYLPLDAVVRWPREAGSVG